MRIIDLRLSARSGRCRAAAQVIWEQANRPTETLFFEVSGPWADRLQLQPEAFVLACLPFAFWCGEQRLRIEAALCPRLGQQLRQLIQLWEGRYHRSAGLQVEPEAGWRLSDRAPRESTAALFSGGVDALSMVLSNRLDYPQSHAGFIRACLFLYGLNAGQMGPDGPDPDRLQFYRLHQQRLQELAAQESFNLIPIMTNVRSFAPSYQCWSRFGFRPATVAAAYLFMGTFTRVLFAADGEPLSEGSEALEVPCLSSAGLDVWLDKPGISRMEKLELLSHHPDWIESIQPCHLVRIPRTGFLNCGRCEKCLRTKLSLLSLGQAISPAIFADAQLQPFMLMRCPVVSPAKIKHFQCLVIPLWQARWRGLAVTLWLRLLFARLRLLLSPAQW